LNIPTSPSTTPEPITLQQEKVYTAGTLRYDQRQLVMLFVWLMWNDFSITLLEQIGGLNGILMQNLGATFTQMALLGSIGAIICPLINPWVSTWSDRHRGPLGRRRPFLFMATPVMAVFLMLVPFMPDLFNYLQHFPVMARLFSHIPMNGAAFCIGMSGLMCGLFNAVVMAIFSYLYWDVVPETVLGRFQSLSKIVSLIAGLIWNYFIYGQGEHHPKIVYVGTGTFCLLVYLLSVWKIKEGEYPPPDVHKKGGVFAPVRAYFVECYSQSFYLWIFVANLLYYLGMPGGGYQFWYQKLDLKFDLSTIGWINGTSGLVTTGAGLLCGFAIGSFTDRVKGVRLMAPCQLLLALLSLLQYFIVHDKWTFLVTICLKSVVCFAYGVVVGAFTVEVFPREKLGQFCSAQAVFYQLPVNLMGIPVAIFFDHVKNYRLSFLFPAFFGLLSALAYTKVYFNWKKRHGIAPVPHGG